VELFRDGSDPREIEEVRTWGLVSGVTTNPTLIPKVGPDMLATLNTLVGVSPGPVLVQVVGWQEPDPLISQAKWLHQFSDRIIVKLPMSIAGIQALLQLKQDAPEMRLAVTTVASISQAYLCGKAGADIVAIFNGSMDQDCDTPVNMVPEVRRIYANYGFSTKILSCGRFPRIFGRFAIAGTDICTMKMEYMRFFYEHAFTEKRMNSFMNDWKATFGGETWPER